MDTFTYVPAWSSQVKRKPDVLTAGFGDGYEQRIARGLNNNPQVWSLRFKTDDAEADAIEAFFETQNGASAFQWTNPRGVLLVVKCPDWDRTYADYDNNDMRATFVQVFDNG